MSRPAAIRLVPAFLLALGLALPAHAAERQLPLQNLKMPDGFSVEIYARVPGAREINVVPELKALIVGTNDGHGIFAAVDEDGDGKPDKTMKVVDGLTNSNGAVWLKGKLYVPDQTQVLRYDAPDIATLQKAKPEVVYKGLTASAHHGQRYITVGPDGKLYVSAGAPCNVCEPKDNEGGLLQIDPDSGKAVMYARGIRNTVGIDFQPKSGELYFTDNGADLMGDDSPPDELNHAPKPGLTFGFPYYGGGADRTAQFKGKEPPRESIMPVVKFGAHVAALGLHFNRGSMLPEAMRGDAFVAEHGSWNRTVPDGYRVTRVKFDASGKATGWEPFMEGWIAPNRTVWGRPVDVKELADGSLLVSDDQGGAIYRVTYKKP
jgi:glucose/arabinose dehydrogenase